MSGATHGCADGGSSISEVGAQQNLRLFCAVPEKMKDNLEKIQNSYCNGAKFVV